MQELDIGDREGMTDYIDFIRPNELTHPVAKGTDRFGRKFFVIQAVGDIISSSGKTKKFVQTFFQRYCNNEERWMGAFAGGTEILNTSGGMQEEEFKFLNELINGHVFTYDELPERFNPFERDITNFRLDTTSSG